MAVAVWQQVLALDARYNVQRAVEDKPSFRTLYMRRRSQLLRENAKRHTDQTVRQEYLQIRKQLLQLKFDQLSDAGSEKARSSSRVSNFSVSDRGMGSRRVIPTEEASASRAMVGDTSIAENYAFAGVFHIFDQHKDAMTVVEFANDDKTLLACASMDSTVSICRLGDGEKASSAIVLRGHTKGVTCCEWSASNDWLVSTSLDGQMILWDAVQGLPLRVVSFGKDEELYCCAFAPMNNNFVIVGNNKGLLRTTSVSTGIIPSQLICNLGHKVLAVGFHPGGGLLWAGDDVGGITAFAFVPTTGHLTRKKRTVVRARVPITGLQCRTWLSREACDPTLLVNCGQSVFVFRVANDDGILIPRCCFNATPSPERPRLRKDILAVKSSFGRLMSFRKGVPIVAGSQDGSVCFFDLQEPSKPAFNSLQGHSSPVVDVSFNSDESFLASGDASGSVIIWTRSRKES